MLIIGNGLTLDLLSFLGEPYKTDLNTSRPLGWKVPCPGKQTTLLECLPNLSSALKENGWGAESECNEFELFSSIVSSSRVQAKDSLGTTNTELYNQLRIYLCLAYSYFDSHVKDCDLTNWGWFRYLDSIKHQGFCVVSFNYDLVIERAMRKMGLTISSPAVEEPPGNVFVGKPHGSIDFDVSKHDINVDRRMLTIPANITALHNNTSLQRLNDDQLMLGRVQYEVVPPARATHIANYQWVKPIYNYINLYADQIDRVFIIGHSYAEVDRAEINKALSLLKPMTRVVVTKHGRDIDKDLRKVLVANRLQLKIWKRSPLPNLS